MQHNNPTNNSRESLSTAARCRAELSTKINSLGRLFWV